MNTDIEKHRALVDQFPDNEMARFSLGKALHDAGQLAEAKEQFVIALERKPDWMIVQILAGKCDLALGDTTAAKAAFERGRELAIEQEHDGPREEMDALLAELE